MRLRPAPAISFDEIEIGVLAEVDRGLFDRRLIVEIAADVVDAAAVLGERGRDLLAALEIVGDDLRFGVLGGRRDDRKFDEGRVAIVGDVDFRRGLRHRRLSRHPFGDGFLRGCRRCGRGGRPKRRGSTTCRAPASRRDSVPKRRPARRGLRSPAPNRVQSLQDGELAWALPLLVSY